MQRQTVWLRSFVVITALATALVGCATIQKNDAMDAERTLAAAGFQMKLADTPEKLAHLKTLPQRKLVPTERGGKTFFMYADATYCKCLYMGTEKAYQRYQNLTVKQNIAEMNETAAMNWGAWGAWGPWY